MYQRNQSGFNLIAGMLFVFLCSFAFAQNNSSAPSETTSDGSPSLAAVARAAKAQKNIHAKKVITDEDMNSVARPLPPLKMYAAENADDIVAAISEYKKSHTTEQTEMVVHDWYSEYDGQLAAAIQANMDLNSLRAANMANGYDLCAQSQNYMYCQNRNMQESRDARHDQMEIMSNNQSIVRIQHAFMNIRNGLAQNNLHYIWFKIRTTNNIDTF